jgi:hypothetical protein
MGTRNYFPGVNWTEREMANHLHLTLRLSMYGENLHADRRFMVLCSILKAGKIFPYWCL